METGGIFPHLRIFSRWDPNKNAITLYRDAIRERSRKTGVSVRVFESFAIFHEYLHIVFPHQRKKVERLSQRLERALDIMPNTDGC